jgi:hypothetical protein
VSISVSDYVDFPVPSERSVLKNAKELKKMNIPKNGVVLLALLLAAMVMVPMVNAAELSDQAGKHFSIESLTTIKSLNVHDKNELKTEMIPYPQDLTIPQPVKKFDLVTFDMQAINENAEKNQNHVVVIGENKYPLILMRSNFENIDDGIDSYYGTLKGIKDSEVLLTIADNVITGSVRLYNETFYIKPVEPRMRISADRPVLHIIYSSNDVSQEKPIKNDDGTLRIPVMKEMPRSDYSGIINEEPRSVNAITQWATVNILVATDNQFYTQESNWMATAQDIINTANSQNAYGRNDIQVSLSVMSYDDSKRTDLSNDADIVSDPLGTFYEHFSNSYLNANSADIALYLGGYNANGDAQGASWGYENGNYWGQWAWAQMVYDDPFYTGTVHGRRSISIHELGHIFNANHEDSSGTNRACEWWNPLPQHTVMYSYFSEYINVNEFSSDNYHGDSTHDNALSISNAKGTVATYKSS